MFRHDVKLSTKSSKVCQEIMFLVWFLVKFSIVLLLDYWVTIPIVNWSMLKTFNESGKFTQQSFKVLTIAFCDIFGKKKLLNIKICGKLRKWKCGAICCLYLKTSIKNILTSSWFVYIYTRANKNYSKFDDGGRQLDSLILLTTPRTNSPC